MMMISKWYLLWMRLSKLLQQLGFEKLCVILASQIVLYSITPVLLDFHLMARVKTDMDQFRDGLNMFGFLDMVKTDPEIWRPYFMCEDAKLTPGKMYIMYAWLHTKFWFVCITSSLGSLNLFNTVHIWKSLGDPWY